MFRQQYRISAVPLIAQTGLQFDVCTPQGKLVASIMAALAEFEPDSIGERIRSGIAAAHAVLSRVSVRDNGSKPSDWLQKFCNSSARDALTVLLPRSCTWTRIQ